MKKLLILMLVLGLASSASAQIISLDPSGTVVGPAGGYTLNVVSDTDNYMYSNYLAITDATFGSIVGVTATAAAGSEYIVNNFGAVMGYASVWQVEASDTTDPYTVAADIQFIADISYTGTSVAETLTIELLEDVGVPIDSVTYVVPEPMTIALLGLGSLFLLRRRK